jgi:hypothetical protein
MPQADAGTRLIFQNGQTKGSESGHAPGKEIGMHGRDRDGADLVELTVPR